MDKEEIEWFQKELGITDGNKGKLERLLSHYGVNRKPTDKEALLIRWGEYCGSDNLLACLIDNLYKLVDEREFKWKAHEVSWWWFNMFNNKCMIDIQPFFTPVGLAYGQVLNDNKIDVRTYTTRIETKKLDGLWQDYMIKLIDKEIESVSEDCGEISFNDLVSSCGAGDRLQFGCMKLNPESFNFDKIQLDRRESLKDHTWCTSCVLDENEVIISRGVKPGLIWCPYVLGMTATSLPSNRIKYLLRYGFAVEPENKYEKYSLVE
jgi:hypothetical protein